MKRNFNEWISKFKSSISNYTYYVDFEKVYRSAEKYKIELSIKSKNDLKNITMYIKDKLQEPNIAKNYVRQIKEEIKILEYIPQKFSIIDMEFRNFPIMRKLIIKNHIAFYIINEKEKVVFNKAISDKVSSLDKQSSVMSFSTTYLLDKISVKYFGSLENLLAP